MATIKVFSADGVQELKCFDTLDDVPFEPIEEIMIAEDEAQASDDSVDF